MKPYYEHAGITIYHGDCREIIPQLPKAWCAQCSCALADESILAIHLAAKHSIQPLCDLLLTDPPYVGREDLFSTDAVSVIGELLTLNRHAEVFWPCVHSFPWEPDAIHIWHKAIPIHPNSEIGNVAGHQYERILSYGNGKRCEVFRVAAVIPNFAACAEECCEHPTQKPLALISQLLKRRKPESVIDPFMGSGTALIAAKNHGISAIGIEIEEKYCEIAANRLSQEVFAW